jgi:hypothetical protein
MLTSGAAVAAGVSLLEVGLARFDEVDHNVSYAENGEFQVVVDELRSGDGKRNPRGYELAEWQANGWDENSLFADPLFVDPANHDFHVRPESAPLKLGFTNFEMGKWGLTEGFPEKWLSEGPGVTPRRRSLK